VKKLWILLVLSLLFAGVGCADDRVYIGCYESDSWYCDMGVGGCGAEGSATVYYDEYSHWWLCHECDKELALPHEIASCVAPNTCLSCGAQDVSCQNIMCDTLNPIYKWDETYHWEACPDCGEPLDIDDLIWTHTASCDAPNTCDECGAQGVKMEYTYHADEFEMRHDEYYHWEACVGCGARVEVLYGHVGYCDAPTTCIYCDATDIVVQEIEHDYDTDAYDDTHCWWECVLCGDIYSKGVHKASCWEPERCIYCDQRDVTIAEFYNHAPEYRDEVYRAISDTQCQLCCKLCGMGFEEPQQHAAYCWDKEECYRCGYGACVDAIVDEHEDKDEYVRISDTEHQHVCSACGEALEEPARHWSFCSGEQYGWCYWCGAQGVINPNIAHEMTAEDMGYDAATHWYKCSMCDEPMSADEEGIFLPHTVSCDQPQLCTVCGATGITAQSVEHVGEWEWTHNDTQHFYECTACGAHEADEYYIEQHFSTCDAPTVCWNCEYVGPNCLVLHAYVNFDDGSINFEGALLSDANGHWRVCPDCGDKTPQPHEYDDQKTCKACGYKKPPSIVRVPGDADGNESITLSDAIAVLEYVVGTENNISISNADVTGDDKVDAWDALRILQYNAGWDVVLY